MPRGFRKISPERRQRILEAARALVLRQGLRATTMEAVAREAGVAKPTLYAYFADKHAVIGAIADALAAEILRAFDAALAREGDVVARVGEAIAARHRIFARTIGGSPHAGAILSEDAPAAMSGLRAVDQRIEAATIGALQSAGLTRARPLAQLLLAAADGVGRRATGVAEIGPAIRLLAERLLRPEFSG